MSGQAHFGDYFEHVLGWWGHRDDEHVLFLKYEDMKKDLPGAVASISKFIGSDVSPAVLDQIVARTTFDEMRKDPKANHSWTAHRRDPNEPPFMRRGAVGDWKHLFSKKQSKRVDSLYCGSFVSTGLELDFGGQ